MSKMDFVQIAGVLRPCAGHVPQLPDTAILGLAPTLRLRIALSLALVLLPLSSAWALTGTATPGTPALATSKKGPFRIVLDPGHGGNDQGTIFQQGAIRLAEKDVTLTLAREAARQLRNKGFEVELTRTDDQELPLNSRTAIANRIKADLFISIHMNSHGTGVNSGTQGIETYILNNATDATSKRLAHFENSKMSTQAGTPPSPGTPGSQGTGGDADIGLILKDLTLDANLSESKRLACAIQNHLVAITQPAVALSASSSTKAIMARNRGVKQALFYVLLGADMPSVLVEAGFLTHATDRALVTSPHGQRAIGAALVRAIEQFKRDKDTPSALVELSRCKVH